MNEQIFITGATGCIGHYVMDQLMNDFPTATFHLLVRDPKRFKSPIVSKDNVMIHRGDMDDIGKYQSVLNQVDYLIHIATVWGYDLDVNIRINRDRMLEMFNYLDEQRIKKIIYFSTASILGPGNQLSDAAKTKGIPYVKSKFVAYEAIQKSNWKKNIVTLFPTIVIGGNNNIPYSHISQGLQNIQPALKWLKWVTLDGSFHFLHAADIAKMVSITMTHDCPSNIVMGTSKITFKNAILTILNTFNTSYWKQFHIPKWIISVLVFLFKWRLDSWAIHCIKNPYFEYEVLEPSSFNRTTLFPKFKNVLEEIKTINKIT